MSILVRLTFTAKLGNSLHALASLPCKCEHADDAMEDEEELEGEGEL